MKIKKKQKLVKEWFIKLQYIICHNIEKLEKELGSKAANSGLVPNLFRGLRFVIFFTQKPTGCFWDFLRFTSHIRII